MVNSFTEWLVQKTVELDEAMGLQKQLMGNDTQVEPQRGNIIINNSSALLSALIKFGKKPELRQADVNPDDYSTFTVTTIDGNTVTGERKLAGTYTGKIKPEARPQKLFDVRFLRDVTDSFQKLHIGNMGQRYYINVFSNTQAGGIHRNEAKYKTWQDLMKANSGAEEGELRAASVMSSPSQELVRGRVNQGADDRKVQQFRQMAAYASSGADMTGHIKDEIENPGFMKWLRQIGAGKLVDQLWEKGFRVPGESGPQQSSEQPDIINMMKQRQEMDKTRKAVTSVPGSADFDKLFAHHDPTITSNGRYWKTYTENRVYEYYPEN